MKQKANKHFLKYIVKIHVKIFSTYLGQNHLLIDFVNTNFAITQSTCFLGDFFGILSFTKSINRGFLTYWIITKSFCKIQYRYIFEAIDPVLGIPKVIVRAIHFFGPFPGMNFRFRVKCPGRYSWSGLANSLLKKALKE